MEKIIWVIGNKREDMIDAQRSINSTGSMKAVCILSVAALHSVFEQGRLPSLIILDYEMSVEEQFETLQLIKTIGSLAEIPLFFMTGASSEEALEECYEKGAISIIKKPFSKSGISRIEHMAWQFDVVKNSEDNIERQAYEIAAAKEIKRLNDQLKIRNDFLKMVFGKYFSDEVMENILNKPDGASIGGERMEMTVMMADLRGFTATAQSMPSDNMMDLLNYYFGKMTDVITKYKGTVIEFLGDGILAVFGAPIYQNTHTESAIAAGICMQNAMSDVNDYCRKKGYELLDMGIGIHRGQVFIGNIGSEKVMRYNVIGSVVNECSRIESYSVGGQVLVSASTVAKLTCPYTLGERLEIKAKGVREPIYVSQVLGLGGDFACEIVPNEELKLYNVKENIVFEMYVISGKFISDKPIKTKVKALSYKNAIVEFTDIHELEKYMDVKLVARTALGTMLFEEVYAKITAVVCEAIKLHFTHTNGEFQYLIEQLSREGDGD